MVRTIAYCTAGVLRTKRTPARMAESRCSRGRPVKRRPRRQVNSAASTAMIDTRVQRERQAGAADQDQHAGQRRPDRAGQVEADAVQRDRLHQVLARHQLRARSRSRPARSARRRCRSRRSAPAARRRSWHAASVRIASRQWRRGSSRPARRSGTPAGRRCRPAHRRAAPAGTPA